MLCLMPQFITSARIVLNIKLNFSLGFLQPSKTVLRKKKSKIKIHNSPDSQILLVTPFLMKFETELLF